MKRNSLVTILAATFALLSATGVAFYYWTEKEVLSDPAAMLSDDWSGPVRTFAFLRTTRKVDPHLADLIEKHIMDFEQFGEEIGRLSDQDLRLLRNALFAVHGYDFETAEVQAAFGDMPWYHPDARVPGDASALSEFETDVLSVILRAEASIAGVNDGLRSNMETSLSSIPGTAVALAVWDFTVLPPDGKLSKLFARHTNLRYEKILNRVGNTMAQVGIPIEDIQSVAVFELPETRTTAAIPYEVLLRTRSYDSSKLVESFRGYATVESFRGAEYWHHDNGSTVWMQPGQVFVGTSQLTTKAVMKQSKNRSNAWRAMFHDGDQGDEAEKALMGTVRSPASWPDMLLGPIGLKVNALRVTAYRQNGVLSMAARGELKLEFDTTERAESSRDRAPRLNGMVPHPSEWVGLILETAEEHHLSYSVRDNILELAVDYNL